MEKEFEKAIQEACVISEEKYGYNPIRFKIMLAQYRALDTAKRLLQSNNCHEGFLKLWEKEALHLSVEAHVIKPEFCSLFTEDEVKVAFDRLTKYEYFLNDQEKGL